MSTDQSRGSLIGPVLLIGAGSVFLLNNLGMLSWNVWGAVFRLWPVLLIAIGLDLIVGRRSLWGSLLVAVVVLALLGGAIWWYEAGPSGAQAVTTEQIVQPVGEAARAEVDIHFGAGELRVEALGDSANLVDATVALNRGERLNKSYSLSGDTARISLGSEGFSGFAFGSRWQWERTWTVRLNPEVPMTLAVSTGVGSADLDLSRLQIGRLDLNTGVGSVTVTLPRRGRVRATLDGGVGLVTVLIPSNVAAHIEIDGGLGQVNVVGDFVRTGDTYRSSNFEAADDRVELSVDGGVGNITIKAEPAR